MPAQRSNYGFTSRANLYNHFRFHEDDENGEFASVDDYGSRAESFLDLGSGENIFECTRKPSGVVVRYHQITQEFMLLTPDGFIITYYFLKPKKQDLPNNRAYVRNQCSKP